MLAAAKDQEYARADQLKKRIIELTTDMESKSQIHDYKIAVNQ
jgi:hypothetical protein